MGGAKFGGSALGSRVIRETHDPDEATSEYNRAPYYDFFFFFLYRRGLRIPSQGGGRRLRFAHYLHQVRT